MAKRRKNRYIFAPERKTHRLRHFFLGLLSLLGLSVLAVWMLNLAGNNQVEYLTRQITVETLPSDLESFSILHMSDLHAAWLGKNGAALREVLTEKNVSCIVLTGDMVGVSGDAEPLLDLLSAVPTDVSVYLIAGDSDPTPLDATAHGSISPYASWLEQATDLGAVYLDEPYALVRGNATLWLVPEYLYSLDLDSMEVAYTTQRDTLKGEGLILTADQAAQLRVAEYQLAKLASIREKLDAMTEADVQVAVTHIPLTDSYASILLQWTDKETLFSFHSVSLVLAGHYCGGQWRIPSGGALYCPDFGWFPSDDGLVGLTYLSGIPQYISPGLGASPYYPYQLGRIFNSPSVTYLQLTSKIV